MSLDGFIAGVLDEILVCIAPVVLGDGVRLFDHPGGSNVRLERLSLSQAPLATNLWLSSARPSVTKTLSAAASHICHSDYCLNSSSDLPGSSPPTRDLLSFSRHRVIAF